MDLLDPLESNEPNDVKMMNHTLTMDEHSVGSDDDPRVDHLSPQTLLETPQEDVQYSFRTADGTVTYGVLKVEEEVPTISGLSYTNAGVQQVLAGNGQLYVIGNPNEVFVSSQTSSAGRVIAPRSGIMDNVNNVSKVKKMDERRRATHNEVERRRRDKINNWITKLSKIIPENTSSDMVKGNGHYDGQSKGGILAKACDYIIDLREKFEICAKENKRLSENVESLKSKNVELDRENKALREVLRGNGIDVEIS
ncbi:PREDICTED: upstream stimulatory factor 1 isoform X2 [Nicrophorus vespilloides]|uniref:Upstream stimulatory factor 1 isoform X2 n=1 Tax=Nicrophorus vespilloides TaxID=110193 RepID=A0ABM1NAV3_NICVS|nr:PREDICTED: upstream stimulatory factor 1 isoform X2 [Nicrophorus vespilloides]